MTPELFQRPVNRGALIFPVELPEQSSVFDRDTILAPDDQLKLNAAPLARSQTAEMGTAVQEMRTGAEPRRHQARQHRRQLRGSTQQCEAGQGRVRGKLGTSLRNVHGGCQKRLLTHRDLDRRALEGTAFVSCFRR